MSGILNSVRTYCGTSGKDNSLSDWREQCEKNHGEPGGPQKNPGMYGLFCRANGPPLGGPDRRSGGAVVARDILLSVVRFLVLRCCSLESEVIDGVTASK